MKKFLVIVLLLITCSCHTKEHKQKIERELSPEELAVKQISNRYEIITNEAMKATIEDLKTKYKMECEAFGAGSNEYGHNLYLQFSTQNKLTVDKGKELIVYATEDFVYNLSKYDSLMENTYGYSFNENNIHLLIGDKGGTKNVFLPNIYFLSLDSGIIVYWIKENDKSKVAFEEPYLEAYKEVYGREREGNVKKQEQVVVKEDTDPYVITEKKFNRLIYKIYLEIKSDLEKTFQVKIRDWDGYIEKGKRNLIIHFSPSQNLNVFELKELMVNSIERSLKILHQYDQEFKEIPYSNFNEKNMLFFIHNKKPQSDDEDYFTFMENNYGIIHYVGWKNDKSTLYDEPYEEVYKTVKEKQHP